MAITPVTVISNLMFIIVLLVHFISSSSLTPTELYWVSSLHLFCFFFFLNFIYNGISAPGAPRQLFPSYLKLGIQVSIWSHHILVLLLARGFDEDLLGLPELLLHASHHRAVLSKQSPATVQHLPSKPGAKGSISVSETMLTLTVFYLEMVLKMWVAFNCYIPVHHWISDVSCSEGMQKHIH